jgi:predicted Rossmann fold flavoprotein
MVAATLLEKDFPGEIHLIEKNPGLGRKVLISGGGRCNVTTGEPDVRKIFKAYPRGSRFLNTAIGKFPPNAVCAWFEEHGVPLKMEADGRVFPVSDDGKDVVGAFQRLFKDSRVHLHMRQGVKAVSKTKSGFLLALDGDETLAVDALVLTCGGQAYRHTGSVGEGYGFAEALGHTITPLAPSLNSFVVSESWVKDLAGLSFQRANLTLKGGETTYEWSGPFIFTHRGVSGPAVFALSSLAAYENYTPATPLTLTLDLFPDQSFEQLRQELEMERRAHPSRFFKNTLDRWLPPSLISVFISVEAIPFEQRNAEVSNRTLERSVVWMKQLHLSLVGRGAGDEFVTAGGVNLSEVDGKTMESKICPGLFFSGEILDIDGFTGGYNLQAAWATGHLVGETLGSLTKMNVVEKPSGQDR